MRLAPFGNSGSVWTCCGCLVQTRFGSRSCPTWTWRAGWRDITGSLKGWQVSGMCLAGWWVHGMAGRQVGGWEDGKRASLATHKRLRGRLLRRQVERPVVRRNDNPSWQHARHACARWWVGNQVGCRAGWLLGWRAPVAMLTAELLLSRQVGRLLVQRRDAPNCHGWHLPGTTASLCRLLASWRRVFEGWDVAGGAGGIVGCWSGRWLGRRVGW